jgi:hypothetical protein
MIMDRETPRDWVWAYHVTPEGNLDSIAREGLKPNLHEHAPDIPVVFVEPDLEGVTPYYGEGMAVLRFKTPGFGTTEDGEDVLFAGDPPFVGPPGEAGVIPPERIQILVDRKFRWLI